MSDPQAIATVSAQDLLSSFGVNTHSGSFDNDGYVNASLVIRSMDYLGLSLVRDTYRSDGVPGQVMQAMADAGIKFDFVATNAVAATTGAAGVQSFVDAVATFAKANPGQVIAMEGQNEVDLYGTNYLGDTSMAAAVKVQQLLYADVKANAALAGVSVYNMALGREANYASLGNLGAYSDFANAHFYSGASSNVDKAYATTTGLANQVTPGEGYVVTETGFTTSAAAAGISVDELAQAKMTLTDLLMAYANGSAKTYLYQLLDTPSVVSTVATSEAAEKAFGLFNADGSPKLAATTLHNFTTLLNDTGGTAAVGSWQVQGLGTDGHSLNIGKADGGSDLVVWRDVSSFSTATNSAVTVAPVPVTVTFSSVQAHVYVYNPLNGLTPIASYSNVSSITLPLSDTPLIVELGSSQPYVATPDVAANPTLTIDTTDFVAQIDALSQTVGITAVALTDSHVLKVASIQTMQDIVAHYGALLAKVSGGVSFQIENAGPGYKIDTNYDQTGKLVSTSTYTIAGTLVTGLNVVNASGATDHYSYAAGVTTDETHIAADGSRSTITHNAAGATVQRTDISATGTTTTWMYNPTTGAVTTKTIFNPDKSGDVWTYAITGKSYTAEHDVYGPGNTLLSLTRTHADGTTDYYEQHNADGSVQQDFYTSAGVITQEVRIAADGGRGTTNYDSAGRMILDVTPAKVTTTWAYDASGALATKTVFAADKSGDVWHYGITGKTYVADHYVYGAGTALVSLTRLHTDGTQDYYELHNADGSIQQDYYSSTGVITQEVRVAADGGRSYTNYDSAGRMILDVTAAKVTTTWVYDATGTLTLKTVFAADKSGDVWHYGITGKTYVSDHYVYGVGGAQVSLVRLHADGSRDYYEQRNPDGSMLADTYGATGISLEVRTAADGSRSTLSYDSLGRILQRQDVGAATTTTWAYDAASGTVLTKTMMNADKSGTVLHYGITGKTYVSDQYVYSAGGGLYSLIRLHADGSRDYYELHASDGSTVYDYYSSTGILSQEVRIPAAGGRSTLTYDATGHLTQRQDVSPANTVATWLYNAATGLVTLKTQFNADKSGDVWDYGITGKTYVADHTVYAAGSVFVSLTRTHADGSLDYAEYRNADGSTEKDYYDATGTLTSSARVAVDGGTSTRSYDGTGHLVSQIDVSAAKTVTSWKFDPATGTILTKTIANPDGSGEQFHYGVTGQTYVSDHIVLSAGGAIQSLTRYHADGTLDFTEVHYADGSKLLTNYDAAGNKTLGAFTAADGSKAFHGYAEVTDQQTATARLLDYSALSGAGIKIAGTPTVNLVDASGHVLHALDASAYSIVNGMLTLNSQAVAGQLATGQHAYVDVTYAVTNGTTTAPTSVYSIQIDGTASLAAAGTSGALSAAASDSSASTAIDTIYGDDSHNILDGRGGVHLLIGGKGDDIYYVDNANTKIVELQGSGEGYDIAYSSVSYSLAATFVEELHLTGTDNINASGNSQVNTIYGNAGNNVINGMGGSDTLFGGGGNDTFVFTNAGKVMIGDFAAGDTIDLSAFLKAGKQATVTQTTDGALVTIDSGTSILVEGITMSHLIKDSGGYHFG
jgi:YD repeat-containing protein